MTGVNLAANAMVPDSLPWALYTKSGNVSLTSSSQWVIGYDGVTTAWPEIFEVVPRSATPVPIESTGTYTTQGAAKLIAPGWYLVLSIFLGTGGPAGAHLCGVFSKDGGPFSTWSQQSNGSPIFASNIQSFLSGTSPLSSFTIGNNLYWFLVTESFPLNVRYFKQGVTASGGSFPRSAGGFTTTVVRIQEYLPITGVDSF